MIRVDRPYHTSGVVSIALSDPQRGNALTRATLQELSVQLAAAEADDRCRAVVIRSDGLEFCRGLDLESAFSDGQPPELPELRAFASCLSRISSSPKPVLACVEGRASGGGVGLVAACDMVLASPAAEFILPEVIVGMIPALIGPFLLRRVSAARLRYLALSSRAIAAVEAQTYGLVDEVIDGEMAVGVERQLRRLARSNPRAMSETKRYVQMLEAETLDGQIELAIKTLDGWISQPEVYDGIRHFAEGSAPPWFPEHATGGRE